MSRPLETEAKAEELKELLIALAANKAGAFVTEQGASAWGIDTGRNTRAGRHRLWMRDRGGSPHEDGRRQTLAYGDHWLGAVTLRHRNAGWFRNFRLQSWQSADPFALKYSDTGGGQQYTLIPEPKDDKDGVIPKAKAEALARLREWGAPELLNTLAADKCRGDWDRLVGHVSLAGFKDAIALLESGFAQGQVKVADWAIPVYLDLGWAVSTEPVTYGVNALGIKTHVDPRKYVMSPPGSVCERCPRFGVCLLEGVVQG